MTEKIERKLAAILSADVVGYSRLMHADESGTLARLQARRKELIEPKIAEHGGRLVKLMGDGALVEYPSVIDAVQCAVEIQQESAARNAETPEDERIELRVGINVGDVIIEGDDIYGEGVNVAARLDGMAEPGGICISRSVRDQIRDRLDHPLEDLGEVEVKNIARPVRVFRVILGGDASPAPHATNQEPAPASLDKPSIAVLAFENMSGDAEQEYFADGIAEDIITSLSKFRQFDVIARNSSFTYKGSAVDLKQVARELDVRFVLEGSVRSAGGRVRITAQLIDASSGNHVWAERYDRTLDDIFAVQDEITQHIIGSIAPGILAAEMQRAQRAGTENLGAWGCVMRAHRHIWRFTKEGSAEAKHLLLKALELDPHNATALADLALVHHFEAVFGWGESPQHSHAQFGEAARRAVAIDDQDASAQTALAIFDLFSGRHDDASQRLRKAIELNPSLAFASGYLAAVHAFAGEREAALPNLEKAIRLSPRDPLVVIWNIIAAWAALNDELFEEAIDYARKAIQENPEFTDIHGVLAASYGHLNRSAEARAALDEFLRRMPNLTASDPRLDRPFKRPADKERFLEGLRKAGLPE